MIVVTFLSALVLSSVTEHFLFSRDIYFGEFETYGMSLFGNATDSSGNKIVELDLRIYPAWPNSSLHSMRVGWQHPDEVEIDSIVFRFFVPNGVNIYMDIEYPGAPSIPYSFAHKTGAQNSYEINIKDLGGYGTGGAVTTDFILQDLHGIDQLLFEAEFSMHYKAAIQVTAIKAHAHFTAPIPTGY